MIALPGDTHRHVIVGKTGSGKTQAAVWHLSRRRYDIRPWIVVDYKADSLINSIGATEIDLKTVPKKPGLYIVHPIPETDDEKVDEFLLRIWQRENIGLYIDEGYMVPDGQGLRALLTQGRSKHIPMIILSQRPVWLSRFVFSEADFFQVFLLNDKRDRQTVASFLPPLPQERLPPYWSWWYDVGRDSLTAWRPVPGRDAILKRFRSTQKRAVRVL